MRSVRLHSWSTRSACDCCITLKANAKVCFRTYNQKSPDLIKSFGRLSLGLDFSLGVSIGTFASPRFCCLLVCWSVEA